MSKRGMTPEMAAGIRQRLDQFVKTEALDGAPVEMIFIGMMEQAFFVGLIAGYSLDDLMRFARDTMKTAQIRKGQEDT